MNKVTINNYADMPLISVCLSMYNSEAFLRECIDSILNQSFTNFELLIVDDGSTDYSREIVESYGDPRIRLIANNHNFIASLNLLLEQARGKYIARMDADDRMMHDRLLWQYEYMEAHPEVDVLGGGMHLFGTSTGNCIPSKTNTPLTFLDMLNANQLANPTTILRRATLEKHHLRYEKDESAYSQDYRLWMRMLQLNLHLENLSDILIEYRISDKQVSNAHREEQQAAFKRTQEKTRQWLAEKEQAHVPNEGTVIPESGNRLTVILTFLNEGEEVINTVQSIRKYAGDSVDIIAINDHSYDGYDYYNELSSYRVHYFYNAERKGVAGSRDLGVCLCSTPYFLLLDAHMRFYDNLWVDKIVRQLEQDDRCILCCQTKSLNKDLHGRVFERKNVQVTHGAYIPFMKSNYLPDIKWKSKEGCPGANIEPIPAILGAGYAASKRYWNYIRGVEGLLVYGCDEAYLSLKVWLEGGRCLLLKDVVIGHIYRTESPYMVPTAKYVYNYLFISSLLFPEELRILSFSIARCIDQRIFGEAIRLLQENSKQVEELKVYYQRIFTIPFEDVLNRNRILDIEQENDILRKRALLPFIADFLIQKGVTSELGIVCGIMNDVLFFFHYARFTGEERWQRHACVLLDKMLQTVYNQDLSTDFENGLSGIGWGLIYLQQQGFLKTEIIEDVLLKIDRTLGEVDIDTIDTSSFAQGIGGFMWYWVTRLLHSKKQKDKFMLNRVFVEKMMIKVEEVLQQSSNVFIVNAASQFKYIIEHTHELDAFRYIPSIKDWMNFPLFLAKNPKYWKVGMAGCTGTGLFVMLVLNCKK